VTSRLSSGTGATKKRGEVTDVAAATGTSGVFCRSGAGGAVVNTSVERRESMARWVAAGSPVKVGWAGGPAAS
jgi:hypothetical protein